MFIEFKYIIMKGKRALGFLLLFCSFIVVVSCNEEGIEDNGTGVLTGTVVLDGTNTPLQNVKISSTPASNTVFTDENGQFTIDPIGIGEFSVKAELDDYVTNFESAVIFEGETTNVVFELELSEDVNDIPIAPVLVFPEDNAIDVTIPIEFLWNSSITDDDEIEYTFELRNGQTNQVILNQVVQDTTLTVNNLALGVNYFWQVTADDGENPPVASLISSFRTKDGSGNEFFFVRQINGNSVIFSGTDTSEQNTSEPNENEIALTSTSQNSFRPRMNRAANKIAFLRTVGAETHLFTMDLDGSNVSQLTSSIPVAGFRQDEIDFAWHSGGIYYPNFDKLHSINLQGVNVQPPVYTADNGIFVTEIDGNELNNLIAIKTNDISGFNARIFVIDPDTGDEQFVVVEGFPGALGGIDYSIDGSKVLYTRDVDGFEVDSYRQLDTRIFEYIIAEDVTIDYSDQKPAGTNDLDAKYSPDEGNIICVNVSNSGGQIGDIISLTLDNTPTREILFTQASMPDWE